MGIDSHATSVKLELSFWLILEKITRDQEMSIANRRYRSVFIIKTIRAIIVWHKLDLKHHIFYKKISSHAN
ncbi:ribbon-helix-helix domain-containing protein [Shewanella sp. VB17]|uniref:ribbon-helix-helix domain-containing protein n=1 Tax=Shewanella sp. VB17 TaxID=2739432 RepID=UPI00281565E2|nr:ribbon-helix-helix domain-containing protein [Shewanella sp. VB17]